MYMNHLGFPGGSGVKNTPANSGDTVSIPGSRRLPGEVNGNPLQYSCLGNPIDRGAGQATAPGFAKSQTRLSNYTTTSSQVLPVPQIHASPRGRINPKHQSSEAKNHDCSGSQGLE